jgi:AcrR family transcriptional regulator
MRQDALDKAAVDPGGTAARILDAAEAEFAALGFGAASTREIARRARVPFGALHYHWGSKRQLWQAVFKRLTDRMRETLVRNLVPGDTPAAIVDSMTDAFLEMLVANRDAARLACRAILEPPDASVVKMMTDLAEFGLTIFRELVPGSRIDGPLTIFVVSTAFLAIVADEAGQQATLGGSVFTSLPARERLRAELRRMGRRMCEVEG